MYVAIDVGGTSIKYGLVDEFDKILERREMATDAQLGGIHILSKVLGIVEGYRKVLPIKGVGISTAGMVNSDTGAIFYASELIPGYAGINYKQEIEARFGIPCEVENDVNCAGLAESVAGAAKGAHSALVLTVGTGIGGCSIVANQVQHGFSFSACEIGYMLVDGERFEGQAATSVLVKRVAKAKGDCPEKWNGKRIFQEAKAGDQICCHEITRMVDILGKGIANICYVLNPQIVVLGGGIMAQQDYLEDRLNKALDRYLVESIRKSTSLAFARLQNDAGMLGAYYNLRQKMD